MATKNQECENTTCCEPTAVVEQVLYSPDVDIHESEAGIQLTFDLPGVGEKDLEISIEKDLLTLVGHVSAEEHSEYQVLYNEYVPGDYRRVFRLPELVNASEVEATIKQGVLTVNIPKVKPKTVTVKAV